MPAHRLLTDNARPPGLRLGLTARLFVALSPLVALLAAALIVFVLPSTTQAFARHGEGLLREGSDVMHDLANRQTDDSSRVLIDVIRDSATARQRALQDLPLGPLGGETAAIRRTIEVADAEHNTRQRQNVQVLAGEMQRRAEAVIERRLAELADHQREQTAAFASGLRTTHLILLGAALGALVLVLGLGVHFLVVQPTRRLRQATQRVATGELAVHLPPPTNDELGDLARDFAAMVEQLRASRAETQRLAAGLEDDVRSKTQHLEQALAELRCSHQQLAQAERLTALGTLAGGIAHEFHNLIGGIRGCAAELRTDEPAPDRCETLAVIIRAADRATGIVQQLLRFARRSVERTADVDPAAVVEDALRLCEPAARRQNVRVDRSLQTGLCVHGDGDGLHQVFVNLLLNALQAMPAGGTLRITVAARGDAEIGIEVADTGAGIAPVDLPHIFEPFFTTRGTDQDGTRRGSGLGLSVSYGIVTAHGGQIRAASTPGVGTTFTIVLPQAT